MSDHNEVVTLPELEDLLERGRQFQQWANENGFGRPSPDSPEVIELKQERDELRRIIEEAIKELEMVSPVSSKVRPLFDHVENALTILKEK